MTILVTGLRHSGTTYIARLLGEHFDLGAGPFVEENERQGAEWRPLWEIAQRMADAAGRSPRYAGLWTDPSLHGPVRAKFHDQLRALDYPDLVKVPDHAHLFVDGVEPEHVVLVRRHWKPWAESIQQRVDASKFPTDSLQWFGAKTYSHIHERCRNYPMTEVTYDDLMKSPTALYELEQALDVDLSEAYTKHTRPDWWRHR